MKKLAVLLAIVAALLLLLPGLVGGIMASRIETQVEEGPVPPWSGRLTDYERGWFKSRARITVGLAPRYLATLASFAGPGEVPAALLDGLPIVIDVAHGPIAVLDGVYFGLAKARARADRDSAAIAAIEQQLAVPYLFEFRSRTAFLGRTAFALELPPLDLPVSQGARLTFSGGLVEGTASDRLAATGGIESLWFTSPAGTLSLQNLGVDFKIQRLPGSDGQRSPITVGDMSGSVERIALVEGAAAAPLFQAAGMRMSWSAALDAVTDRLRADVTYAVDDASGADMRLSGVELTMRVAEIDRQGIEVVARAATQSPAVLLDPAYADAMARLLAGSPRIELDPLRFKLDDQAFDAKLSIAVDGANAPPLAVLIAGADPTRLLSMLDVGASLTTGKALAVRLLTLGLAQQMTLENPDAEPEEVEYMAEAQTKILLGTLESQQMLVNAGDDYRSEIKLADGVLTVNGNTLPLGF